LEAYWIYAYKKEGKREPQEMERSRNYAKRFWDMKKGDDNG
jgi:hypothetical protein